MTGPGRLPRALYRAEQTRALDQAAIEGCGIPGITLMERAGRAAFEALRTRWPAARRLGVVCGGGNNAGDGFVVARLAAEAGLEPLVGMMGASERLRGDAATAWQSMGAVSVPVVSAREVLSPVPDVVVDALLGTGLDREVDGEWAAAIDAVNACPCPVLAVDIPSGLSADSGRVLGRAVVAEVTVTFIGLKRGLFTGDARDRCGELVFSDLNVPGEAYAGVPPSATRHDHRTSAAWLGPRRRGAHKGECGHVLVVGGDVGYAGAGHLAAEAAARGGAGLVSLATRAAHVVPTLAARPEIMARGVEAHEDLERLLERVDVVAIGPGLGRAEWGRHMLYAVLKRDAPLVLDADGLNLVADEALHGRLRERSAPVLITPHPGEAARLLECTAAEVEADRFAAASELARRGGAVALLKGAGTLVAGTDGTLHVCQGGNPGMASGGMGDVLTGLVASLLAQGLEPWRAAVAGACIHGAAADRAAMRRGERGLLAGDLLDELGPLLNP